jgi:hypothetical protein
VYLSTDNGNTYRDNGTTWDLVSVGGSGLAGTPPAAIGWSTNTLGTTTFAADKDGYLLTAPAVGSGIDTLRMQYRTLSPTSNYTATFCIDWVPTTVTNSAVCVGVGDGTKWVVLVMARDTGGNQTLRVLNANSATSFASTQFDYLATPSLSWVTARWWRIRDNGTSHFFGFSHNGIDFNEVYSQTRTGFLTPSVIGWGANVYGSGYTIQGRLRSLTGVA